MRSADDGQHVAGWGEQETHSRLEVGDEIVAVLLLLETGERHFGTRNVLEGEVSHSRTPGTGERTFLGFSRYSNIVCSVHVTPLLMFAAVYV